MSLVSIKRRQRFALIGAAVGAGWNFFNLVVLQDSTWGGEMTIAILSKTVGGAIGGFLLGALAHWVTKKPNSI